MTQDGDDDGDEDGDGDGDEDSEGGGDGDGDAVADEDSDEDGDEDTGADGDEDVGEDGDGNGDAPTPQPPTPTPTPTSVPPTPGPLGCDTCLALSRDRCWKDGKCYLIRATDSPCSVTQCTSASRFSQCACSICTEQSCIVTNPSDRGDDAEASAYHQGMGLSTPTAPTPIPASSPSQQPSTPRTPDQAAATAAKAKVKAKWAAGGFRAGQEGAAISRRSEGVLQLASPSHCPSPEPQLLLATTNPSPSPSPSDAETDAGGDEDSDGDENNDGDEGGGDGDGDAYSDEYGHVATETRAMEMGMPTATVTGMDKNPRQHRGDERTTATQQRPAGRQPLRSPPPRRKHMWIRLLPNRARIPSEPR